VNVLGSRDDRKESQTVICSKAEDFATIAPGKLSSEKAGCGLKAE
jgi:hypothetical protein